MERGDNTRLRATGKLRIPKPTRHAYINFVQDFRQTYKGAPRTSPQMVALAAQAWRGLGERERAPYEAVAAEERLKPRPQTTRRPKVARLRSQLRLLKEQVAGLKTTAKRLQVQGRRRRALRRPLRKRVTPKSNRARRGNKKPKRAVKKARRVVRRPRQTNRKSSCTSVSSSCCSSS